MNTRWQWSSNSGGSQLSPLSIVCWCLAVQINLLIPSITWLLESSSFSFGFLLRKITGKGERSKVIYKRARKKNFNNEKSTKFGFTGHGGCCCITCTEPAGRSLINCLKQCRLSQHQRALNTTTFGPL